MLAVYGGSCVWLRTYMPARQAAATGIFSCYWGILAQALDNQECRADI